MGRVYEALNRGDSVSATAARRAEAVADIADIIPDIKDISRVHPQREAEPRDFDFVSYSLNAPSLPEVARIEEEQAFAARERLRLTAPARTVELQSARVDPRITASFDSMPAVSSEFNKAAIALISASSTTDPIKRVLVTSAEHGSGKTSAAINIALALSRGKKRVLLIDCDFQRPSVLRLLGLEADKGLAEMVKEGGRHGDAAIRISPSGLTVIPMLGRVDNPAELLAGDALSNLLTMIELDYDFVLADSAPLLHSAEARLLAPLMDRVILVVSPGKITSAQLSTAISPLTREQVLGVIMNRCDRTAQAV
ncbi:MAG TPA: CpsD/CapB family tyrosine-protein kinase [Blastocatellia bacterium]